MQSPLAALLEFSYYAVFGLTLVAYVRDRTAVRRDIVAVVASVTVIFAFGELSRMGVVPTAATPILVPIIVAILFAEPYLILRLVRHVRRLPPLVLRSALAASAGSTLAFVLLGSTNRIAMAGVVVYFLGAHVLATVYFTLEAARRRGSSRGRLALAAMATGLFGLAILVAGVAGGSGGTPTAARTVTQLLALFAALGYLAAFTPPGWLRRMAQRAVAFGFIRQLALLPGGTPPDEIWRRLLDTSREVTNSSAVAIGRRLPDGAVVLSLREGPRADSLPARLEPKAADALLARGPGPVGLVLADPAIDAGPADGPLLHATAIGLAPGGETPAESLLILAFSDVPMFGEDDLELLGILGMATARAADREIAFARIERSERMLAESQRQAHLGSWEWEIATDTVTWSDELFRIHGLKPQSVPVDYQAFLARVHPDDREHVSNTVTKAYADHRPFHLEHRIIREDGAVRTLSAYGAVETDALNHTTGMSGTGQDISDRKLLEERLIHQAFRDALTGLANRALFVDRVKHALSRRATRASSVAVLFLDLDDFKNVNDTLGHGMGDDVLKAAAIGIEACVRPSDTVARLGGDEFAVLLEDIADATEAIAVADRILEVLERPVVMIGRQLTVTASLGIATNGPGSDTPEDLMRNADVAMYRAKAAGKRRRALFDPQMLTTVIDRLTLARELQHAAERGELRLHFQPILGMADRQVSAVEALVRWQHPSRGLLYPGTFIPMAEETNQIIELGRWVLREACQQAAAWASGWDARPIRVSVNISALQLQDDVLLRDVDDALSLAGLPADRLMLEITEGILVEEPEAAVRRLQALKQLGVGLAIDDFGTGYSSLSYLTQFPIDTLKIDGSFVAALSGADDGNTVARTIVELGQALGLDVIAEGVELDEQVEILLRLGCREGQGYLFAPPLDPESLERFLADASQSRKPRTAVAEDPGSHPGPNGQGRRARRLVTVAGPAGAIADLSLKGDGFQGS